MIDYALTVEQLEERLLLAGNVTVQFIGGTLVFTGDGAANDIDVSRDAQGDLIIQGFGTNLDGQGILDGVIEGSFFDSGDIAPVFGSNIVNAIRSGGIVHSISINGGSGNDVLTVGDFGSRFFVTGSISINGDGGDDFLSVIDTDAGEFVDIVGGSGMDTALLGAPGFGVVTGSATPSFLEAEFVEVNDSILTNGIDVTADDFFISDSSISGPVSLDVDDFLQATNTQAFGQIFNVQLQGPILV